MARFKEFELQNGKLVTLDLDAVIAVAASDADSKLTSVTLTGGVIFSLSAAYGEVLFYLDQGLGQASS